MSQITKPVILDETGQDIATQVEAVVTAIENLDTFSGNYADLEGLPTLGTASALDVAASGNASSSQVVKGNDTRLTDARPSSDVVQTYNASSEVPISGKGVAAAISAAHVTMSMAEYQALPESKKNDGTEYFIPDASQPVPKIYGFSINGSESNPASMVTYLADAVGMTPAAMNFTTGKFNYGSWEDVWFVKNTRPCILGQDGTVIKYLDPNDFTKDTDGNTVDISSTLANANVMIEFPKIWYKVVPDTSDDSNASIYISNVKVDPDYKDYAYINHQGIHKEHFYMPAYNGSYINNVMRSVSGAQVGKSQTGATEIQRAQANGDGWYTEDAGEIMLINFLLVLMGKSCNTQAVFGEGLHTSGTEALNDGFRTGVHNTKGMFYGTNSGTESSTTYGNAVKVFGIENYWGFQWRRYAGDMCLAGNRVIKLCWGTEDGSTTANFNTTGSGYVSVGATPSGTSGGYINKMKFTHDGMYSSVSSGTSTTYYCDGQWFNNSANTYALRGGSSVNGAPVGAFYVALHNVVGGAWWDHGAAVSYK